MRQMRKQGCVLMGAIAPLVFALSGGCSDSGTGGASAAGGAGGGSGMGGGAAIPELLRCGGGGGSGNDSLTVAFANPGDFSINPDTHTRDQHTFRVSLTDWARGTTLYTTGGNADHQHEIPFPAEFLSDLQTSTPIVATTGPPLGAAGGHTHTVMVVGCGIPGG